MSSVSQGALTLRAGGVVCFPTESSYGLAVDPRNGRALERLAAIKGRDANSPFALIAGDLQQAQGCTEAWPSSAQNLAQEHWPGPLTLILPPSSQLGPGCIGPSGGVGVRISSVAIARDLALGLGYAITATSANPSGQPAATRCSEARAYFAGLVDCYIDGGRCAGQPSTLVDFGLDGAVHVLREGPIVLPPQDAP